MRLLFTSLPDAAGGFPAAANFRMGLYADDGGLPGALLAQTAGGPVAQVTGWQEFPLAAEAYVAVVASGHYWIAG